MNREVIIKETHRGLWYEDGVMKRVLPAGRFRVPRHVHVGPFRTPKVEVVLVDVRERDLTIKGQEILTADKVALRVSIIVQFRVTDPQLALHAVEKYEDRLYSDVQLAARRSLAGMVLEEILTNRSRLSEEIRSEVQEIAARYGVAIGRADVKDLAFPGNLQEIMNRVLAAERQSQAELIDSRTKAEKQRIESEVKIQVQQRQAEADAHSRRTAGEADAAAKRLAAEAEIESMRQREQAAVRLAGNPAAMRLEELLTLRALGANAQARLFIGFDKHMKDDAP